MTWLYSSACKIDWVWSKSSSVIQSVLLEVWGASVWCDPEYEVEPGVLPWQLRQVMLLKPTDSSVQEID